MLLKIEHLKMRGYELINIIDDLDIHMLHKLNKKLFGFLFKMGHYFYQYLIYQNYDM